MSNFMDGLGDMMGQLTSISTIVGEANKVDAIYRAAKDFAVARMQTCNQAILFNEQLQSCAEQAVKLMQFVVEMTKAPVNSELPEEDINAHNRLTKEEFEQLINEA